MNMADDNGVATGQLKLLPGAARFFRVAHLVAVLVTLVCGGFVLACWKTGRHEWCAFGMGGRALTANTGLALMFVGFGLALLRSSILAVLRQGLGVLVFLIGVGSLLSYLALAMDWGWLWNLDALLVPAEMIEHGGVLPASMSLNTALSFVFAGAALMWCLPRRPDAAGRILPWLALGTSLPAVVALNGYLFDAPEYLGMGASTLMAIPAALLFIVSAIGLIAGRPQGSSVEMIFSVGSAGLTLRLLLPAGLFLLLVLEMAALYGRRSGYYDASAHGAIVLTAGWLVLGGLILRGAWLLAASDRERNETEGKLRDSESRYRALVEASPQIVWFAEADGSVTFFNQQWSDLTGLSMKESGGRGWMQAVREDARARVEREWLLPGAGRSEVEMEIPLISKSGEVRWHLLRGVGLRDSNDAVSRWVGIALDIHDRKAAEDAQRESEERFRLATKSVSGVIYDWNPKTDEVQRSAGLFQLVGVDSQDAPSTQRWWLNRVHTDDVGAVYAAYGRATEAGDELIENEYRILHANGSWVTVWDRALLIWNAANEVVRVVGTCTDVTARRKAEDGLREADQRKNEFLAMLGHELRNPLASVRNAATLLLDNGGDPETREWASAVIQRQSGQLGRLVDDLLDVARITKGRIELRVERVDAAAIVDRAVEALHVQITEKRHELTTEVPRHVLWVDGDPARLEQIILNLIGNAIKYTGPGGKIAIEGRHEGEWVGITVRDNGAGIRPDQLHKVWELFVQGDRLLARSEGGLGIGLTVVKSLVELHHGKVRAESDGVGRGAAFTVLFPSSSTLETAEIESSVEKSNASAAPSRVLVVDDNKDTTDGLTRLLVRAGYIVQAAYDGPSALVMAADFRPEIVLLDLGLPVMDGFQVAKELRRTKEGKKLKLIALSGYGQDEDQRRSREAGFDLHLVKPVEFAELRKAMVGSQVRAGESP